MTTTAIREKLHNFINTADDNKVKAIYTIVADEITEKIESDFLSKKKKIDLMKQASSDPLFLADLKEINDDFANRS